MPSDEEKREIARQFILASPCHELRNVIKDVRVLVGDDSLIDALLPEAVRQYNMENLVPVDSPYGNVVVLCEAAQVEDGSHVFVDPVSEKCFTVTDHVKLVTAASEQPVPSLEGSSHPVKAPLSSKLSEYVAKHYRTGASSVHACKDGSLNVVINSEKSNPGSNWTGRWKTTVTVSPVGSDGASVSVTGIIHNSVHYYEEGNVQMDTSKEISKECKAGGDGGPEALAKKIVGFIEDSEFEFHSKIDEMCQSLSDKSLKCLRRRLPVSKQLFNFSSGAHKLAVELTQGVK